MLKSSSLCLYSSNLGTFWRKIEQFWPFEEISIFSNGGHLGYKTVLTDTILKGDHPRIISGTWRFFWLPLFESSSWLDKIHILGRFSFPTKDMLIFLQTNPCYELFSVWDWNDLGTGWQESESLGIRWNGNHIINAMQWILHPNFFAFSLWLSVKWWCFSIF